MHRVVIIGPGKAGSLHEKVLRENLADKFEIAGIVGPEATIKEYTSFVQQHGRNHEGVIIATPPQTHLNIIEEATSAMPGMNYFLEKPMAMTRDEAVGIERYVNDSMGKLMVSQIHKHHPEFEAAYDAIHNGEIGKVLGYVETIEFGDHDTFHDRNNLPDFLNEGGVLLHNGSHSLSRLGYLGGGIDEIELIEMSNQLGGKKDDNVTMNVTLENGSHARVHLLWDANSEEGKVRENYTFHAFGTAGHVKVAGFRSAKVNEEVRYKNLLEGKIDPTTDEGMRYQTDHTDFFRRHEPGFTNQLRAFADFMDGDRQFSGVKEAIETVGLVEDLYRHARQK